MPAWSVLLKEISKRFLKEITIHGRKLSTLLPCLNCPLGRGRLLHSFPQKMFEGWDALSISASLWREIQSSAQASLWRGQSPVATNQVQTEEVSILPAKCGQLYLKRWRKLQQKGWEMYFWKVWCLRSWRHKSRGKGRDGNGHGLHELPIWTWKLSFYPRCISVTKLLMWI